MLRRSSARCQPGLYCRCPSTLIVAARSLSASIRASASSSSGAVRMMPTRSFIVCWRSCWIVYGLSPPSDWNGATARPLPRPDRLVGDGRSLLSPEAYAAAASPARRPNTSRSERLLPPSRLEPCMPPEHSPTAYRPVTEAQLGVRVDLDTAHHVVAGRPDLHRLGGDVDVGQLLELVVHRRQPLADELRRRAATRCRGRSRRAVTRARLDLGVDGPCHLVTRQQLGWPAVVLLVVVPAVRLLLGVGGLRS